MNLKSTQMPIARPVLLGLLAFATMALSACEPEPVPAGDPCAQPDPGKRALAGSYVRQQSNTPSLDLIQLAGDVRRNGRLSKLYVGEYKFDARIDRDLKAEGIEGAFKAARDSRAVPVDAFRDVAEGVVVYDFTYREKGKPEFNGLAVTGPPTPPSQIAKNGNAKLSGPIMLRTINLVPEEDPTPVELFGIATISIKYGSGTGDMEVTGLGADAPFQTVTWKGVRVCGARIVSSGQGGFQLADDKGEPVNFAGASDDSPSGSAIFDGRFFGSSAVGTPTSVGGGVLIQGDSGLISGVFVAIPEG